LNTLYGSCRLAFAYISLCFTTLFFAASAHSAPADDFVFTVKITSPTFTFAVPSSSTHNYNIDCDNDGIFESIITSNVYKCDYSSAGSGTYTIRVKDLSGDKSGFPKMQFNTSQLLTVDQWGTGIWQTMEGAFSGAINLTTLPTDVPNFSQVTSFSRMFYNATKAKPITIGWDTSNASSFAEMFHNAKAAEPDTSGWNTSNITTMYKMFKSAIVASPITTNWDTAEVINMAEMFHSATSANPDTSGWNTAKVTTMKSMFHYASIADPTTSTIGDIWNTTNVESMASMFAGAEQADPDTSGWVTDIVTSMYRMFYKAAEAEPNTSLWNTANVKNMDGMFWEATKAQPDTSNWDTSQVTTMYKMFKSAEAAKPDTSGWDTKNVTTMHEMFRYANAAKPDTRLWDTSNVTTMSNMFIMTETNVINPDMSSWDITNTSEFNLSYMLMGSKLSTQNYDNLLKQWRINYIAPYRSFDAGNSNYCLGLSDRASLTTAGWTIKDGNHDCSSIAPDLIDASDSGKSNIDDLTSINTPTFSVYCPANGAKVILYADSNQVGTHDCTTQEYAPVTSSALTDDDHIISFTTTESSVVTNSYPPLTITIDSTMANLRTPNLQAASDTGTSNIDNITSLTTLDFSVYCPTTSSKLSLVYDNGSGTTDMASLTCTNSGWTTIAATGPWPEGASQVSLLELNTDAEAINHSQALAVVQTSAPTIALTLNSVTSDSSNTGKTLITGQVSGNFIAGDIVTVLINGTKHSGNVDNDGNYAIEVDQADLNANNSVTASINVTDAFNQTTSASVTKSVVDDRDAFVFTIKTDIADPLNQSFALPLDSSGSAYNFIVDCDGTGTNTATVTSPSYTCTYPSPGTYTVVIQDNSGTKTGFSHFKFLNGDKEQLISHDQWGTSIWEDMAEAFSKANNLTTTANDVPNLTNVDSFYAMFNDATKAMPNTSGWDTSNIKYMNDMFYSATAATPDTSSWDTANVENMAWMFSGAKAANPVTTTNINVWNTSKVKHMNDMFANTDNATPNTSGWDTSLVESMDYMFHQADAAIPITTHWNTSSVKSMKSMFAFSGLANPDTSKWSTISVTDMSAMFEGAKAAMPITVTNGDIWNTSIVTDMSTMFANALVATPNTSGWNTEQVENMSKMFANATQINPVITSWDITKVTDMTEMFAGVKLPTASYDTMLKHWHSQVVNTAVPFDGGLSNFCYALSERTNLESNQDWVMSDAGQNCATLTPAAAPDLLASSDLGVSSSDNITSLITPSFALNCPTATAVLNLYSDNPSNNSLISTYPCTQIGSIDITANTLTPGVHNIHYTQTISSNAANVTNTTAASSALAVTIDLVPTLTINADQTLLNAGNTSLITFNFSEAVTDFSASDIIVSNGSLSDFKKLANSNQWTAIFTPNALLDTNGAATIITVLKSTFTDSVGNTGTVLGQASSHVIQTLAIDSVPPIPAISMDSRAVMSNAQNNLAAVTGTVTGDFNQHDLVTLTVNGHTYTGTVDATGQFSIAVNEADLLANSTISASITTTDSANNTASASINNQVIIDYAPTLKIVSSLATLNAQTTSIITFEFNEAVSGFEESDVTTTHGSLTNFNKVTNQNQWTAKFTPALEFEGQAVISVPNGAYIDTTSNTGNSAQLSITIDTKLPVTTITLAPTSLVTGSNALGNLVAVTGQVTGEFNPLDPITLTINGNTYTGTVDATGQFSIAVNEADLLANSTISASITTTDSANNTASASINNQVIIDYAPTLKIVSSLATLNAQTTSIITFEFNEAVSGFEESDVTTTYGSLTNFKKVTNQNQWTAKFTPALEFEGQAVISVANGAYADVTSNAGNGAQLSITIDTKLPVTTITLAPTSLVTGSNALGNLVTVTGQVTGEFNPLDPITLTINGNTYTGTVDATGLFNIAVNEADLLANSTISASITTTDSANNIATTSISNDVTIDYAPSLIIDTSNNKVLIAQTSTIGFKFSEAVSGFTADDIIVNKGSLTALAETASTNNWTAIYTPPADDNGAEQVTITVAHTSYVDNNGNLGQGNILTFTIDTLAPAAHIVVNDIDRNAIVDHPQGLSLAVSGHITGDYNLGDQVTLKINGHAYNGPVDSDGKFSIAVPLIDLQANEKILAIITVTDDSGNSYTSSQQKNYSANLNSVPVANSLTVSTAAATAVAINLTATDSNDDVLTYAITQPPISGVLIGNGQHLTYTPAAGFNGNDSFKFMVTDPLQGSSEATVTIAVAAPIVNLQANADQFTIESDQTILLNVLANDLIGDNINIVLQAVTPFGEITIVDNEIEYTPAQDVAGDIEIAYSISSNGQVSSAIATVSFPSELAPVVSLPSNLCGDLSVNANALYTKVDLGEATALDRFGNALPVSLIDGRLLYPAGINNARWQATDSYGIKTIKSQTVCVHPLISLDKDQTIKRDDTMQVGVYLNGESPVYPLTINYQVSSGRAGQMHALTAGQLVIAQGTESVINLDLLQLALTDSDEIVRVELTSAVNAGSKSNHLIYLSETQPESLINLEVLQNEQQRFILAKDQGVVTITATYPNVDNYQDYVFQWMYNEQLIDNLSLAANQLQFDLTDLATGHAQITVNITDNDNNHSQSVINLAIVEQLAQLTSVDSDGDLISDIDEGYQDSDGDFIPDYLDRIDECNVLQQNQAQFDGYLIEGDAGFCLRRGTSTIGGSTGGALLTTQDIDNHTNAQIVTDPDATNVGGIFDFIAHGTMTPGSLFAIAIPQRKPIPPAAVYRKLLPSGQWRNFDETVDDSLWSTAGEPGYCPPPNTKNEPTNPWQPGLIADYWCVQLVIKDGGTNDDDGEFNGHIIDPGGVSVLNNGNQLPVAGADVAQLDQQHQATIDVLANDADDNNDQLTITSVSANIGNVYIVDNQVYYVGDPNYSGNITIYYGISDGQGGTDIGTVEVSSYVNMPPVAIDDQASTDNVTPIFIDVLANDSDNEGGILQLQLLSVDGGSAEIVDNKIHFVPPAGFVGLITAQYQLTDPSGSIAIGELKLNVTGTNTVKNTTSGGDSQTLLLWLILCYWFRLFTRSTLNHHKSAPLSN